MSLGKLHLQFPDGKSAVIELTGSEVVLGRSPQADIQLADPLTSSRHAKLFVDERGIWLVDLGSTNGTIVDGRQLVPQVPVPLSEGRRIKLGDTTARFIAPPPASLTDTVVTRPIQSLTGSQDAAVPDSTAGPAWRKWLIAGGAVLLLGLLALAIYLMLPSSEGEELAGATVTPTQQAEELVAADSPAGVSIETISPCEQPQMQLVVSEGAPSAAETTATGRPIESLAFLDLPFPYDGGNENFGGSPADFRRAVNRSSAGGRINSFFDHMYPLYPAPQDAGVTFGREPADAPVGQHILIYDGQLSAYDYYSGHPAYDFSTYVPRQPTTPVFAAADGIVNVVGEHSSGALFVKLVHQVPDVGNYQTIYWHLHPDSHFNEMLSRIGEQIPAGTRIGTMGNTGWSTGHHLHFEVRFDRNNDGIFTADESADPFGFIPGPAYPEDPWALPASFSDARGDLYNHGGSVSRYLWVYPLGASTVIPASGGGQTTQEGVGGAGGSTLCVPQGSLPPGGTVTWSWSPDPPFSHQLVSTGNGCVLSVSNADGEFLSQFDQPVRIEIPFAEGDLSNVDPQSLVIFWQDAGSDQWLPLPTRLDLEQGIAVAETNRPGKCALRGRPTGDLVPPVTSIEISGPQGMEDAWYDEVTVVIESSDESGVASIEYSLDAGSTWQPYEGPFVVKANGVPEPLPDDLEEDFGSGPGRFLILASSTDALGNVEDPPVYRHLVIDPSKDPAPTKEPPTMTPTFTITPSPTACVPMVTALLNANVRWGPGLIYAPPVAALQVGETAPIVGRNNDSSWWRIDLDAASGTEYWIADSVVSINCGASDVPVVAIPPTPTSTPTPTPTNTPTPTPTSTPTLTPTATLPPDFRPPVVSITHQPIQPFEVDPITFTASARDNLGVARIEIWVQGPNDNQLTLVSSCLNVTRCVYQGGAYPAGPLRYQAFAWDATGNQGASPIFNIKIAAVIK